MQKKAWETHAGIVVDTVGAFDVIECEQCGFKHAIPIPSPEEMSEYYRSDYYNVTKPYYFEHHLQDLEWWKLTFDRVYGRFEALLPPERRRLLDVGTGPGIFQARGEERGWTTMGIEPSSRAAAVARSQGLRVEEAFLDEDFASRMGTFDVVNLHTVLEHVLHPRAILSFVHRMLGSGGLVCVCVANDYNPLQEILRDCFGHRPWWVVPPEHMNYFSFDSLGRLLSSVGFEIVHSVGSFPMEAFLLMGEDYVNDSKVGRRMHGMRKNFELALSRAGWEGRLEQFYRGLAERGIGRECILIGKRNDAAP